MGETVSKNLPRPSPETEAYWQACKDHQLLIQACGACDHLQFYPRNICTNCSSDQIEWVAASGKASIISYTVMHRSVSKAYCVDGPQVLAIVRLEEGPQMMTHIVNYDEEQLAIGLAVEVTFEDWTEEVSMPVFRPATGDD